MRFVVLGSGKMARDIGLFLIRRGHSAAWVSRSPERTADTEAWFAKAARRLRRLDPEAQPEERASFHVLDEGIEGPADFIIETTSESLDVKRDYVARALDSLGETPPLFSNSSSILPQDVHPACVGVHFFYPVEMTRFAEVIVPPECRATAVEPARGLLRDSEIQFVEQDVKSAFLANRLLMPLHAECFRALMSGHEPRAVDEASVSPLLPMGQLSLMDAVGLDVIEVSARNYLGRMQDSERVDYAPLEEGLARLVSMGKRGTKSKDGILSGSPLPWPKDAHPDRPDMARRFLCVFLNACYSAIEAGEATREEMDLILSSVHDAETTLDALTREQGTDDIRSALTAWHRATGLGYFAPARMGVS